MKYVDWGYAIAFGVLFLYVVSLFVRRRRLERAVAVAEQDKAEPHGAASHAVGVPDGADRDGRG